MTDEKNADRPVDGPGQDNGAVTDEAERSGEALFRALLLRLNRRLHVERPRVAEQALRMGPRLVWYVRQHESVWHRWLAKFHVREQRILSAIFDVLMGLEWVGVTVDDLGNPARGKQRHLTDAQVHPIAVNAVLERLDDLVKLSRREMLINREVESTLLNRIGEARRSDGLVALRHLAVHSSARAKDAWLRAPESDRLWELLSLQLELEPEHPVDPVAWASEGQGTFDDIAQSAALRFRRLRTLADLTFRHIHDQIAEA